VPGIEVPGIEVPGIEVPGIEVPGIEPSGIELSVASRPCRVLRYWRDSRIGEIARENGRFVMPLFVTQGRFTRDYINQRRGGIEGLVTTQAFTTAEARELSAHEV
jgi:hypothetical protein